MVSVCCATYNHEKYLRKALDGVLEQQVNFRYEIIIGEDCSTDNSRKIIEEYHRRFPDIFNVIYHEKNVGARKNFDMIVDRAQGKYTIVLETDDCWIDKHKLQQQVDILEQNPDVIAVAHNSEVIDDEGNKSKYKYPDCKRRIYSAILYRRWILPGQNTTLLYRNFYKDTSIIDDAKLRPIYEKGPGDRIKMYALASHGKIICIQKKMSAYRYVTGGGSSFSATNKLKYRNYMEQYYLLLEYAKKEKLDKEYVFTARFMYFEAMMATYILEKGIDKEEFKQRYKEIKNKPRCYINLLVHCVCRVWYNIRHII